MKRLYGFGLVTAALLALPCVAQAQSAYTTKGVNLRAGPARDYPLVAMLPPSAGLQVQGCLADYTWCDVIYGPLRGWVYAANIAYPYDGSNVPLLSYGPQIGIAVVGFVLGDYWDSYYRGRPFYGQRAHFAAMPPHPLRRAGAPAGHPMQRGGAAQNRPAAQPQPAAREARPSAPPQRAAPNRPAPAERGGAQQRGGGEREEQHR